MSHEDFRDRLINVLRLYCVDARRFELAEAAERAKRWLEIITTGRGADDGLVRWLRVQANYYRPKERQYSTWLQACADRIADRSNRGDADVKERND
jgi:hypothetical protein